MLHGAPLCTADDGRPRPSAASSSEGPRHIGVGSASAGAATKGMRFVMAELPAMELSVGGEGLAMLLSLLPWCDTFVFNGHNYIGP